MLIGYLNYRLPNVILNNASFQIGTDTMVTGVFSHFNLHRYNKKRHVNKEHSRGPYNVPLLSCCSLYTV